MDIHDQTRLDARITSSSHGAAAQNMQKQIRVRRGQTRGSHHERIEGKHVKGSSRHCRRKWPRLLPYRVVGLGSSPLQEEVTTAGLGDEAKEKQIDEGLGRRTNQIENMGRAQLTRLQASARRNNKNRRLQHQIGITRNDIEYTIC